MISRKKSRKNRTEKAYCVFPDKSNGRTIDINNSAETNKKRRMETVRKSGFANPARRRRAPRTGSGHKSVLFFFQFPVCPG